MPLDEMAWFLKLLCPARIKQYLKSLFLSFIVKMDKIYPNLQRVQTAVLFELRKHLVLTQFSG